MAKISIWSVIVFSKLVLKWMKHQKMRWKQAGCLPWLLKYGSGPFGNTICLIENFADSTYTITLVTCSETDGDGIFGSNLDFDCSNIIAGETWNLWDADIPEMSPFSASRKLETMEAPTRTPSDSGVAAPWPSKNRSIRMNETMRQNRINRKSKISQVHVKLGRVGAGFAIRANRYRK